MPRPVEAEGRNELERFVMWEASFLLGEPPLTLTKPKAGVATTLLFPSTPIPTARSTT